MIVYFFGQQLPGLALREFFHILAGESGARVDALGVVAMLAGAGLVQGLGHYMMVVTHVPYMNIVGGL